MKEGCDSSLISFVFFFFNHDCMMWGSVGPVGVQRHSPYSRKAVAARAAQPAMKETPPMGVIGPTHAGPPSTLT